MENKTITMDIAFHPGETLEEKLQEMNLSVSEFANKSNLPQCIVEDIISGDASVTPDIAIVLEKSTKIPAHMWIKMQHAYDNYVLSQTKPSYLSHISNLMRRYAAVLA